MKLCEIGMNEQEQNKALILIEFCRFEKSKKPQFQRE